MQLANFLLSDTKWNPTVGILSVLEKPGRVDWGDMSAILGMECGHCEEHNIWCSDCTLNTPKICGHSNGRFNNYFTLVDMLYRQKPRNKRKALRIARNMYAAILKDDPRREG